MRRSQGSGLSQFKDGLEEFKKKWGDVVSAVVRACKHCERRCRVDGDDGDDDGEDDDGGGGGGGGGGGDDKLHDRAELLPLPACIYVIIALIRLIFSKHHCQNP